MLIKLGLADEAASPPPQSSSGACSYDNTTIHTARDVFLHNPNDLSNPSTLTAGSSPCLDIALQPQDDFQSDASIYQDLDKSQSQHLQPAIAAHVQTFMTYMYTIMPAVDGFQLMSDAANLHSLPLPRYALLLALCAVTRIQLRLDQDNPIEGDEARPCMVGRQTMSGVDFLAAAERARRQFSLVDNMSQEAIVTSFFLFVSYANIEKYDQAWFYLSQSITMTILLGYDREPPIVNLSPKDLNIRRKIFWLLFITER